MNAITATLSALALLFLQGAASAGDDLDAIWNDPVFKKQFIGAYGINAEIEPRVTPDEVKVLEKVRPFMASDLPKAEETLKKQLKADSSAILDFTLGGIQFQQEKMADALESYRRAVTKFPSFRRAWRNLGLIHAHDGRFDDAIHAFTRMIELGGGDAYSYGLLGFAYSSKQDYQAAEAAYRNALLLQPENTEWRAACSSSRSSRTPRRCSTD
jgi:tetratricopeptide (TPR) repeat protein